MQDFSIRRLCVNDLAAFKLLAEIHEAMPSAWIPNYVVEPAARERTVERLIRQHQTGGIFCLVAEIPGRIVAFIWAELQEQNKEILDIYSLWTDPEYRGLGIATKLKLMLEDWAKTETGAKQIITTVSAKNENMMRLNQQLGYAISYYKMSKQL